VRSICSVSTGETAPWQRVDIPCVSVLWLVFLSVQSKTNVPPSFNAAIHIPRRRKTKNQTRCHKIVAGVGGRRSGLLVSIATAMDPNWPDLHPSYYFNDTSSDSWSFFSLGCERQHWQRWRREDHLSLTIGGSRGGATGPWPPPNALRVCFGPPQRNSLQILSASLNHIHIM